MRYLGKATGDLYIKGICGIIFSEIYVEDCSKYFTPSQIASWPTSGIISYSDYEVPDNSEIIFAFSNNFNNIRCGIGQGSGQYLTVWYKNPSSYQGHNYTFMYKNSSSGQDLRETVVDITSDDEVSVKINGNSAIWCKNGIEVSRGNILTNYTKNIRLVDKSTFTPKYIKVKPL